MIGRLSTIAPDLVALLEQQQSEQLRRAAAGVANLAIERTHLSEPRVDAALAALHEGRLGFTPERSAVQYLTEELEGGPARLDVIVGVAARDWRDLLMGAGLADDDWAFRLRTAIESWGGNPDFI
jgi:hypothetical protein